MLAGIVMNQSYKFIKTKENSSPFCLISQADTKGTYKNLWFWSFLCKNNLLCLLEI